MSKQPSLIVVIPIITIPFCSIAAGDLPQEIIHRLPGAVAFVSVEGSGLDEKPRRWEGTGFCFNSCGWFATVHHVASGTDGLKSSNIELICTSVAAWLTTEAKRFRYSLVPQST